VERYRERLAETPVELEVRDRTNDHPDRVAFPVSRNR